MRGHTVRFRPNRGRCKRELIAGADVILVPAGALRKQSFAMALRRGGTSRVVVATKTNSIAGDAVDEA